MSDAITSQPPTQPAAIAAVEPSPGAGVRPVAEQVAALTPAEAKARLAELKSDPQRRERLLKNWARDSSAEKTEWNALTRRAADMVAVESKPESTEAERARAGLEPPPTPEAYELHDFNNRPIELNDEDKGIVHGEVLPVARELNLSQLDVSLATYHVLRPQTFEQCENFLKKSWGTQYDERLEDFRTAVADNPKAAALLKKYPITLGNNGALIASVVSAFRRRQGKR